MGRAGQTPTGVWGVTGFSVSRCSSCHSEGEASPSRSPRRRSPPNSTAMREPARSGPLTVVWPNEQQEQHHEFGEDCPEKPAPQDPLPHWKSTLPSRTREKAQRDSVTEARCTSPDLTEHVGRWNLAYPRWAELNTLPTGGFRSHDFRPHRLDSWLKIGNRVVTN